MGKGKPNIPDIATIIAAGIDPKTGLPIKLGATECAYKEKIKTQLRIIDEQDAVNRFVWTGLPNGISSQELERILYYKGNVCLFRCPLDNKFYFMPYALDGGIDFYGRYLTIHPVPMSDGATDEEKKQMAPIRNYLSTLKLKVWYDIKTDELTEEDYNNSAVIFRDYTPQMSQNNIPRQILNDALVDIESNCIPYLNTALKNSTGVQGMRTGNPDEASNVEAANNNVDIAALNGKKYVPIFGTVDFQDLSGGEVAKAEEFLMAMQGLDNFRLSTLGLDAGGVFQKKAHMLQSENEMNAGTVGVIANDGLTQRQNACAIAYSLWGLNMWCDASENITGMDTDMDGEISDTTQNATNGQGIQGGDDSNDME